MNKKVLTLSAALLLAGSLTAVAQTDVKGVLTYRSNITKSTALDVMEKDGATVYDLASVTSINPNYYYQLETSEQGRVLSADRDYATGKVYLTVKTPSDAVLSHTLWKIKVTDTPANGRVYTYINKETGFELAFDHAKTEDCTERGADGNVDDLDPVELSGCISHWAWYTTDESTQNLGYKPVYAYFHNEADSVMAMCIDDTPDELKEILNADRMVFPVKYPKEAVGTDWDSATSTGFLSIRPVVAGARVLNAAEINSMIDANGSSLKFNDTYTKSENAYDGTAKFTVCKPGTNEPMTFASNPFDKEFKAVESKFSNFNRGSSQQYAGYNILMQATDKSGFLYVSPYPYEGSAFQHIYNGLQVTVEPYRVVEEDGTVKEYVNYEDVPLPKPVRGDYVLDALGARYQWKVTYYATQDSVVFEPLNASRMSSIDQQKGEKAWTAPSIKDLTENQWVNTVKKASDSNTEGGNAGSAKDSTVPVALYAMNFGPESGDKTAFLTVGYADSDASHPINPADAESAGATRNPNNKENPSYITTTYQAKMNLAIRFNHNYDNDYELATVDPGLYFINIKNVKADKTQTENRVEGAYLVEDMKGHLVYDTQDDAQEFLHMPATQWVVEQLNCQKGDNLNTNKTPEVVIYNREFNGEDEENENPLFYGQLFRNKNTGNLVTLNHNFASTNGQTVDHHSKNSYLPCEDQYAFENITAKQTTYGYFNESEAVLRNSTYKLQHLQDMKADKFLGEENGYVKLTDEGTEFELYRAQCWTPTFYNEDEEESTADFIYTDSVAYGYSNDLVKPLYKTSYKLKVKDENLIDNDHKFLAITNQHKYVIAKESEIEGSDKLAFAIVYLKENNELEGLHAYALLNQTEYAKVYGAFDDLKGLSIKSSEDGNSLEYYKTIDGKEIVYFVYSTEDQVDGKLEIENTSLHAKIADRCETTTDAFVLVQTNRPLYYTVDAEYVNNDQKVLALYTQDGDAYLYEDSSSKLAKENNLNYLAVENKTTTTKNEGFYVDKVAKSTAVMPQYLLAVAADSVPAYTYCTEGKHGINPGCGHIAELPGYVTGRYLVNYNDSIKRAVIDKLSSRADAFKSSNYVRLGFVEALHQGDTLYVMKDGNKLADWKEGAADNSGNYIVPAFFNAENNDKIYKKVVLDGKHNNVAFSFRNTGDEDESFLIESNDLDGKAGIGKFTGAWVKLHNNVPVLTQFTNDNGNHNTGDTTDSWKQYADYTTVGSFGEVINQAARFNAKFEAKDASATANEAISTSDVTVAATTGAVVIKGAAGKSVIITNILGQTLTSAVVSSDNATIAVPAGIAVVAVEGEEAVKVVVK